MCYRYTHRTHALQRCVRWGTDIAAGVAGLILRRMHAMSTSSAPMRPHAIEHEWSLRLADRCGQGAMGERLLEGGLGIAWFGLGVRCALPCDERAVTPDVVSA